MTKISDYGKFTRLCCHVNRKDEMRAEIELFDWLIPPNGNIRIALAGWTDQYQRQQLKLGTFVVIE